MSRNSNTTTSPSPETEGRRRSGGVGTTLLTALAALAGTVVGNGLRAVVKARAAATEDDSYGIPTDTTVDIVVTGVVANTIAATALAHAATRRRPLVAFMIGAGLTAATGDMPDRAIQDLFATDLDGFVAMDEDYEPDGV